MLDRYSLLLPFAVLVALATSVPVHAQIHPEKVQLGSEQARTQNAAATGALGGDTVTITGDTSDDPVYNRIFGSPGSCSFSGTGTAVGYEVIEFSVTLTNTYTLSVDAGYDTVMALYEGDFDPNNPCQNLFEYDDDGGDGLLSRIENTLTAGQTYTVVPSGFGNDSVGEYSLTISGPGRIILGGGPSTIPVNFSVVQQAALEGAGSIDLVLEADDTPSTPTDVTVRLVSGDPADLDGFTSATVTIGGTTNPPYVVTVPITDDLIPEASETFVFALEVAPPGDDSTPLVAGDQSQTALIVADNDGDAVSVTVTPVDVDGDDLEDGGLRLFSLPIGGVVIRDIAAAAGADSVLVLDPATGTFVAADPDAVLEVGQVVLVDVAPESDLTFLGSAVTGDTVYNSIGGIDGRALVAVSNPTGQPVSLADLEVEGGTLADVLLVFDAAAGSFRPISLSGLDNTCNGLSGNDLECAALGAFEVVVVQVVPSGDVSDVSVMLPTGTAADDNTALISDEEFTPSDGEVAVVLALRPTASSGVAPVLEASAPGDVVALRFLDGGINGVDAFDALDLETPFGGTLAATGPAGFDALWAAISYGELVRGTPVTIPLVVSVPEAGSYEIGLAGVLEDVGSRPVVVELFDGTERFFVSDGSPFTFEADDTMAWPNALSGRFSVRVSLGAGVSTEDDPSLAALEMYPNPASSQTTVALEVAQAGAVRVSVYDVLGREVAVAFEGAVSSQASVTVDTSMLSPGAYVVRVEGDGFVATRRLTVAR